MERKGSCHLYWGLGFPVCLFTEFDNTEVVEKQRMNVISFSLCRFHLSVCIGFAVHPSRPCPWFPPLKFLSNTCWDWRAAPSAPNHPLPSLACFPAFPSLLIWENTDTSARSALWLDWGWTVWAAQRHSQDDCVTTSLTVQKWHVPFICTKRALSDS